MQFLGTSYNPHLGSAIALVMMIIVMLCMWLMNRFGAGEEQAVRCEKTSDFYKPHLHEPHFSVPVCAHLPPHRFLLQLDQEPNRMVRVHPNWYAQLFQDEIIMSSLSTTLAVSVFAALIATVAGTFAAIGFTT